MKFCFEELGLRLYYNIKTSSVNKSFQTLVVCPVVRGMQRELQHIILKYIYFQIQGARKIINLQESTQIIKVAHYTLK